MNEGPGNLACHCRVTQRALATGRAGSARGKIGTRSTRTVLWCGCSEALQTVEEVGVPNQLLSRALRLRTGLTIILVQVQEIAKDALDILNVNNILGSLGLEMADS